ncbi:hypothetical protein BS47DRAFT_1367518 [Hydnum rufescens UP504]|uniref:Uncharacterized protein n=1 Tax=Hydnum rufescens UP504 TaxID=1448309 RepID=A0A9P6DQ30_9AGAM|nr:hypothetical protein BS47DRAFT_1367518 [Hydnum rufescens UP504]
MSDPSPPPNSIPPFLLPGNLASRGLLATIFHWEHFDKFKHEGLMLVFERDPHSTVYLQIDHMLFENDPWHAAKGSSDSLVPKSFGGSPQAVKDQQGVEREGRAVDWCQPLNGDMIKKYFIASKPGSSGKNSSLQSLSVTHFQVVDSCPNIVDVILAAYAWGGEDDGEMPEGLLVDMRERDLVADQPKIRLIYGKFDAIRERNLNLHTAELRAQAADEAQQAVEEAQREVEELAAHEVERRQLEVAREADQRHTAEAEAACEAD